MAAYPKGFANQTAPVAVFSATRPAKELDCHGIHGVFALATYMMVFRITRAVLPFGPI